MLLSGSIQLEQILIREQKDVPACRGLGRRADPLGFRRSIRLPLERKADEAMTTLRNGVPEATKHPFGNIRTREIKIEVMS